MATVRNWLPQREEVVTLAILDLAGILAIVVAASVLALHAETVRKWWWWGVAAASLLVVCTSVLLGRIWERRRSFIDESLRLADYLEQLKKPGAPPVDHKELESLRRSAVARRDLARASGYQGIEDRLTFALAKVSP